MIVHRLTLISTKRIRKLLPFSILDHELKLELKQGYYTSSLLLINRQCPSRDTRTWPQRFVEGSPQQLKPYLKLMRIDKPIGTWLLFWPCGWSTALASSPGTLPELSLLCLFAVGSLVMRGAGCTINDMWDKNIDKQVARTRTRPLASGELTQFKALLFLGGQLSVGLYILLQLNWYSIILGASSLGLVISYPLMKRITYWPQLILGMTYNWGTLIGWAAVQGQCYWPVCLPLYTAGIAWTLIYDTIYAHQDTFDDAIVGVKSTALKFGEFTPYWLMGFSVAMITSLTIAGISAQQTWPYYLSVALTGAHLARQISTLKIDDVEDCARKFRSNRHIGAVLFVGAVLGTLCRT